MACNDRRGPCADSHDAVCGRPSHGQCMVHVCGGPVYAWSMHCLHVGCVDLDLFGPKHRVDMVLKVFLESFSVLNLILDFIKGTMA